MIPVFCAGALCALCLVLELPNLPQPRAHSERQQRQEVLVVVRLAVPNRRWEVSVLPSQQSRHRSRQWILRGRLRTRWLRASFSLRNT